MEKYTKQPQPVPRTLESNPKAGNQASISDILQGYKKQAAWPAPLGKDGSFGPEKAGKTDPGQISGKKNGHPAQLNAPQTIRTTGVLQRTREDVQKLLPPEKDLAEVLADTSLNIHYRCTLLLINNYGLAKTDKNYIASTKDITPQMIQERGDVTKDLAFNYYQNFIISPTLPPFLLPASETTSVEKGPLAPVKKEASEALHGEQVLQPPAGIETPRDKILRALYEHAGFIQLEDGYTTADTLEKFGLEIKVFDDAFKELWDEKVVAPFKEKPLVSKPGTDTSVKKAGKPTEESEPVEDSGTDSGEKKIAPPLKVGLKLNKTAETSFASILGDETRTKKNNLEKEQLYVRFSQAMKELGIDIFLIGGAASTILGRNKRKINDLDFKTNSITKPFNEEESSLKIAEINAKLINEFPHSVIIDFKMNDQNIHAIDGQIDGIDITIGRFMNPDHFTHYEVPKTFLISPKDLLLDKAESFIFRKSESKKATDLFDLTWTLHSLKYNFEILYTLLENRQQFYEHEKGFLKKEKKEEYATLLKDEFVSSVNSFLLLGSETIHNLFLSYIKNKADIKIVEGILSNSFPAVFGKDVQKGKPSLIIQAGNMTGDMFGVSAAMVLNPFAHVLIIYENSTRDKHEEIRSFYLQAVSEERIHLMESQDMSDAYSTYSGRQNKMQLPYSQITPEIPDYLRSPNLQYPLSEATDQVARFYTKKSMEKIKKAWKVKENDPRYDNFMKSSNIPDAGVKYAILWSRYSGKKGGPHLQHDTSYIGMKQLIQQALEAGYIVLITGDKPATGKPDKFDDLIRSGQVFNLTEFWNSPLWTGSGLGPDRVLQLGFFEYLKTKGEVKHLGFRSGNLESFALLGQTVGYMEEEGNFQKGRMEAWHGHPIGYNRVLVNRPPTLTGQYIVDKIRKEKLTKEPTPEWISRGASGKLVVDKEAKKRLIEALLSEQVRGFTEADLSKIAAFFKGELFVANKKASSKPQIKPKGSIPPKKAPDNSLSGSYQYLGNRQINTFDTVGDGSCGIHAMFGTKQKTGGRTTFRHDNTPQVRMELARHMSAQKEILKSRYTVPIAEIIREIYIKISEKKNLTASEKLQWVHFMQEFPDLYDSMKSISDTEKVLSDNLNQKRNLLIEEIIKLAPQTEDSKLIKFLIIQFEQSTSDNDKECKIALKATKDLAKKWDIIVKSDRLPVMIQTNLNTILDMINTDKLTSIQAYTTSLQAHEESFNLTAKLVENNFDKLFDAYAKIVRHMTYFLRQEDLLTLADMQNEGLVIYREHDNISGNAVEALSHASTRATVRRIFHRGVHYEHAELKEKGTE